MPPVQASRNDGKVSVQISTWLIPIIISVAGFLSGFVIQSVRADDQSLNNLDNMKHRLEVVEQNRDKMVSKDEFRATIEGLQGRVNRIDANVQQLLDIQLRKVK